MHHPTTVSVADSSITAGHTVLATIQVQSAAAKKQWDTKTVPCSLIKWVAVSEM